MIDSHLSREVITINHSVTACTWQGGCGQEDLVSAEDDDRHGPFFSDAETASIEE